MFIRNDVAFWTVEQRGDPRRPSPAGWRSKSGTHKGGRFKGSKVQEPGKQRRQVMNRLHVSCCAFFSKMFSCVLIPPQKMPSSVCLTQVNCKYTAVPP